MVTHHPKDGHPPFKIYQKEVYYRLEIWHLALTHKSNPGEVRMVSPHPQDGHPPSQGWSTTIKINQKELYYRLGIWYLGLTNKI